VFYSIYIKVLWKENKQKMANYYETARSNYFFVKDVDAFKAELDGSGLNVETRNIGELTQVGLFADDSQSASFFEKYDPETFESEELDWTGIFKRHLADNQVAIIMGAGAEKLRYINGWAEAFNNKGESRAINLMQIYKLAEELGSEITRAEY
jgi:hypothetical protein